MINDYRIGNGSECGYGGVITKGMKVRVKVDGWCDAPVLL